MARRRKQKHFQHIGDILQKALKRKKIHVPVRDRQVSDSWEKAVGPIISANTRADRIKGDTLYVKVSTSTWMQQLQFMKHEIIEKVNDTLQNQTIKSIYFSIGNIEPSAHKREGEQPDAPDHGRLRERDKKIIEDSTSSLSDEELKEILKRVMTKEIMNRRSRQE